MNRVGNSKMIRKLLFKLAHKEDKDIEIPNSLIFEQAFNYIKDLIRGKLYKVGIDTKGKIFIGKKTKIYGKKYCHFENNVRLGKNCQINAYSRKGIIIGENSKIGDGSVVRCSMIQHLGQGLVIGRNTSFDSNCFFGASGLIMIGNDVIGGRDIKFHAENHIYGDKDKLIREQGTSSIGISVGNNCWIGSNVTFLDGTIIGDGTIVAAGAVVTGTFPNNVIIGGVPAKVIKQR